MSYVYAATHPRMPGLVKIGMTHIDPYERLKQLSTTGVPGHFELLCSAMVAEPEHVESLLHQMFAADRLPRSEFFEVDEEQVQLAFSLICSEPASEVMQVMRFCDASIKFEPSGSSGCLEVLSAYKQWCSQESRQLAVKATQADHVKRLDSALSAWMNFETSSNGKSAAAEAQVRHAYATV